MPNKQLRIIIVDSHLPRLIQTEKSLNRLGYFRILPIQHVDDLRALDHELVTPFDVHVRQQSILCGSETHWRLFRRTTQNRLLIAV